MFASRRSNQRRVCSIRCLNDQWLKPPPEYARMAGSSVTFPLPFAPVQSQNGAPVRGYIVLIKSPECAQPILRNMYGTRLYYIQLCTCGNQSRYIIPLCQFGSQRLPLLCVSIAFQLSRLLLQSPSLQP